MSETIREFKLQKYSKLELLFSHWKWVRKLSKAYWVRMDEPGYGWVKFDKEQFKSMKFVNGTSFFIEDYTRSWENFNE